MEREYILSVLYDLTLTIGGETQLDNLFKKVLQRFLYHTAFPTGLVLTETRTEHGTAYSRLATVIGDHQLEMHVGQVIELPEGLAESERLPEPLFTPSTKAELGEHDENIDFSTAAKAVGTELAEKVKILSLQIYSKGVELAAQRGIIIADTKFEFGMAEGELILIDEVLTPDSSRFWPKDSYTPGQSQNSFDKQYLRDFLVDSGWDKQPPAPQLPQEIVTNTRAKYIEALELFTK